MSKTSEKAYEAIRNGILKGEFSPGFHLREKDISKTVGVSRTPVREALRRLAAEGYAELVPNRGVFVARWSSRSLSDLIDVRAELAAMAGRLAARRIRREDLDALTKLNHAMTRLSAKKKPGYLTKAAKFNLEFHDIVFKAAGNEWLILLMKQTALLPMVQGAHHQYTAEDWRRGSEHYRELVDALASGDGEWAAAMLHAHFHASKHALLRNKKVPARRRAEHARPRARPRADSRI
jgi:DNA-binding GntR family transcriptional regulator